MTMPMLAAAAGLVAAPYLAGLTLPAAAHSGTSSASWGSPARRPSGAPDWPAFLALALAGTVLALVDAEQHRLPAKILLAAVGAGVVLLIAAAGIDHRWDDFARAAVGAAAVFAVLYLAALAPPRSVGLGDVELAGLLAGYLAWRSWPTMVTGLALGVIAAGVVAAGPLAAGRRGTLPLGPFPDHRRPRRDREIPLTGQPDLHPFAAPSGVVYGCTSLRQTAGIITRTALAYSNLRRLRWWLAYLDLPLMWLLSSTQIVRRPELVASLGTASTHLQELPAAGGQPRRPHGHQLLAAVAILLLAVLILGPVPIVALLGPSRAAGLVVLVWYGLLILLPTLTYAVPALVQQCRGLGLRRWMATTSGETGRRPVLFTELAAWPARGGGRRSTGDGFALVRAIAADVARDDAILVCTARSKTLADKYRTKTGAVASAQNPRHMRWP